MDQSNNSISLDAAIPAYFFLKTNREMYLYFIKNKYKYSVGINTPDRRNPKHSKQSMNADQKSLETVFLIAICRQSGNIWLSGLLFLTIFDLILAIVLTFLIVAYPV